MRRSGDVVAFVIEELDLTVLGFTGVVPEATLLKRVASCGWRAADRVSGGTAG